MKGNNGSELHRLTELKPYDEDLFNRLYKTCKPLIRGLVRGIDSRRFNVTPDIINSFFWDKFLYVFNKYQRPLFYLHFKLSRVSYCVMPILNRQSLIRS